MQLLILNFLSIQYLQELNQQWKKSFRKNYMGVKKAARRTFRKIFGSQRKNSNRKYENSAKFINDKMLNETSSSEASDSDHSKQEAQTGYFTFNAEGKTKGAGDESHYRKLL